MRSNLALCTFINIVLTITNFPKRCTHPSGTLSGEIELQQQDGGEKIIRTVINSNIALEETLCYKITYNYTDDRGIVKKKQILYTLEYDNLKHVYNYKNQYDFAIPATEMTCWCDCPGGSNQCDSDTDSCGRYDKNEATCVNWYEDGQTLDGCLWVTGSGQSCCSLDIIRFSGDTYKAVEIASPVTRAALRLNVIDLDRRPNVHLIKDKVYEVDLDTGTTADDLVTLNIATSSTASLLPAGWYFGQVGKADVKTNVKINGLNEWNMNKLGWMKIKGGIEKIRKSTVRDAFGAETANCGENVLKTHFAASFYNRFPTEAEDATKFFFGKVEYVMRNDSSRQVIAFHRSSPRLDIKLTFKEHSKVVFLFDESRLRTFEAKILLDKFSNRFINISLYDGTGSITGSLKVNGVEGDSFYVYIPEKTAIYTKYVRISSPCGVNDKGKKVAELCMKPLGVEMEYMCKEVECLEERMEHFVAPNDDIDYAKAEHDDILSLSTWSKYLNPIQWFKGGKPGWVESIIMVVLLLVIAFVVGILIKLARMFNCLFKCLTCCRFWRGKSKEKYDKRFKRRTRSISSDCSS